MVVKGSPGCKDGCRLSKSVAGLHQTSLAGSEERVVSCYPAGEES